MAVIVIDYGMSNLGSIVRSLEESGACVRVSDDYRDLKQAERIILPGVGAFSDGMSNLHAGGWVEPLRDAVLDAGVPLLGICLGMQLLADRGVEGGAVDGLQLIPGVVERLFPDTNSTRVPHMGWNEVYTTGTNPLFDDIVDGTDFYFVHSYHVIPSDSFTVLATTPYCGGFVSSVGRDNVFGVQFHPEKSGRPGLRLLKNFISI